MWPFVLYPICFQVLSINSWRYNTTVNLLTVVYNRLATAFSISGSTRAVALERYKVLDMVEDPGVLHKLKSFGISGQVFDLNSSFLRKRS